MDQEPWLNFEFLKQKVVELWWTFGAGTLYFLRKLCKHTVKINWTCIWDVCVRVLYVRSPVFDGLFDFCSMYTGASLEGAYKLNNEVCVLL